MYKPSSSTKAQPCQSMTWTPAAVQARCSLPGHHFFCPVDANAAAISRAEKSVGWSVGRSRSVAVSNRGVRRAGRKHRTCMVLPCPRGCLQNLPTKTLTGTHTHIHHPKVSTVCMCCRSKQPAVSSPWFADDPKQNILYLVSRVLYYAAAPRDGTRSAEAHLLP